MGAGSQAGRVLETLKALRVSRGQLSKNLKMSGEQLHRLQQRSLSELVHHVASTSPLYRDLYSGIDLTKPDVSSLPPVAKPFLMEHFDAWVTDPRITRAGLERHIEEMSADSLYLDEYQVVASSGSTGERGLFVYSHSDWRMAVANFIRMNEHFLQIHPHFPRRRIGAVTGTGQMYVGSRLSSSVQIGLHRILHLDARLPADQLAAAMQRFAPEILLGYPTSLALLAQEQLLGRLNIRPAKLYTTGEMRTAEMQEVMEQAWGVTPYNAYGLSEGGILAADCEHHDGMHLFEDLYLVENVDRDGRPVPYGEVGHKLLVTNLFNFTQPIIRYELSDMVTLDPEPCSCGRMGRRVTSIEGRNDDILVLPARRGGEVSIPPLAVHSPLGRFAEVRQYRVVYRPDGLTAQIVPAGQVSSELPSQIESAIAKALVEAGAEPVPVKVEVVDALTRSSGHGAKFKLIESQAGNEAGMNKGASSV